MTSKIEIAIDVSRSSVSLNGEYLRWQRKEDFLVMYVINTVCIYVPHVHHGELFPLIVATYYVGTSSALIVLMPRCGVEIDRMKEHFRWHERVAVTPAQLAPVWWRLWGYPGELQVRNIR